MADPNWTCLLPAAVTVVTAVVIRRTVESLLAGVLVGLLLLEPAAALSNFSAILLNVMTDATVVWVIIVCGLMGSLIALLLRAGAVDAFSHALSQRANSAQGALLYTWLLGLLVFIDDYLNALAVGSAMGKVTDRFRISREKLAYVVDSTAAPVCMLVPASTWGVFFAGALESAGAAEPGRGMALFISAIPYMLYPWIAVLMVPLVATGRLPALGLMRRAEAAAAMRVDDATMMTPVDDETMAGAETNPPHTLSQPASHTTSHAPPHAPLHTALHSESPTMPPQRARLHHFLLPILVLLGFSAWHNLDVQTGVIVAVGATVALYGWQRLLTWAQAFDAVTEGIKMMVPALTIVVVAFVFKEVNDRLGLAPYVIGQVTPLMSATLLPLVVFVTMALISFATGTSWGVFVIAIPIVLPLAGNLGVDAPLAIGALMSASAFGSHACFYSDSTVLSAQGSGCGVMEHALTQIPYAALAALLAGIGLTMLTLFK